VGNDDNCTLNPTEYTYKTNTLLNHKAIESSIGNCGFLFYLGNNNTNAGAFTVNIFRDDATIITFLTVMFSVFYTMLSYIF
jgi:hypothetical protein